MSILRITIEEEAELILLSEFYIHFIEIIAVIYVCSILLAVEINSYETII